jgi:hypothetical protein
MTVRARALAPSDNPAARIKADEVKAVLADVNADRGNLQRLGRPSVHQPWLRARLVE